MFFLSRPFLFIYLMFMLAGCSHEIKKTALPVEKEISLPQDHERLEGMLEVIDEATEELPDLPVFKLTMKKRTIAMQVLLFQSENLNELEERIWSLKKAGFNTLIVRVFQNKGDRHYRFARKGSETGVYFKTDHAPVVDDILGQVAEISHRNGIDIFAWVTTRYADYGVEDKPGWQAVSYDLKSKGFTKAKGLNLFNRDVKNHLLSLYRDLARYDIDGVLFQDDLVLRHNEGFSKDARQGFASYGGKMPDPEKFYKGIYEGSDGKYRASSYGDEFWQWCKWKNASLLSVAREIKNEMKMINPDLKFAINFMYEAPLSPRNALAWLSQDLEAAVKADFDLYAVMAYHRQISKELQLEKEELDKVMGQIVENTLNTVGDADKTLIKLQIADWETGKIIPIQEIKRILEIIKKKGGSSIAFVPYRREFDYSKFSYLFNPPVRISANKN
ncbi:MAG: family 10 glycosylhydrolase [Proteobacteria bacterium]|nr:family 10 glycosylhydrolase [Pseudomonadota bacterium]